MEVKPKILTIAGAHIKPKPFWRKIDEK